ncbi:MAG: methionyl-tRNA formyltransferase [Acidobacteria bacterium]|nr:methionyl-tRNA formyltransferase [Acidobacteriota bacterium]
MLRCVFFGTPEFAVPSLERLADAAEVSLVVTSPDKPVGRHADPVPSPVARAAIRRNLAIDQPAKLRGNDAFLARLRDASPDLAVVVAYGKILPFAVLDLPPLGCVNVHASLLPRHRGASPVQTAILAGDSETGVSTMRLVEELDAGPVYLERRVPIRPREDAGSLSARLAAAGAGLLGETLAGLETGTLVPRPQEGTPTWCRTIRRDDGEADWSRPAAELDRRLRAFTPWPGLFTFLGAERVKILEADVGPPGDFSDPGKFRMAEGALAVQAGAGTSLLVGRLQREGKKPVTAAEFAASAGPAARFGSRPA